LHGIASPFAEFGDRRAALLFSGTCGPGDLQKTEFPDTCFARPEIPSTGDHHVLMTASEYGYRIAKEPCRNV
jgi:hypothetical protein